MSTKKFWMGIVFGAIAGGAASLLDKGTRTAVKEDLGRAANGAAYIVKNPDEFIQDVKEKVDHIRSTVRQISADVAFISEKVDELKDVPPPVADLAEQAKKLLNKTGHEEDRDQES